jgi:hypothetical protein
MIEAAHRHSFSRPDVVWSCHLRSLSADRPMIPTMTITFKAIQRARRGPTRMTRFLLDMDHLSLLELGHPPLLSRLATVPPDTIVVSAVKIDLLRLGQCDSLHVVSPSSMG